MGSGPSTRRGTVPPLVRTRTPTASTHGPTTTARLRWWVRKRPIGMSAAMRANPKAPATSPTCQSASAPPRASSGRIAGKAPVENVVAKIPRQRSASSGVTRPLMVNHWPMTSLATMRLEIAGALARLTLERPEVLNAGDARFARDLKAAVATLAERPEIRVVALTGAGRAFSTGVDLTALAHGELGMADFIAWEDAMTAMERMDTRKGSASTRARRRTCGAP